jgi:SET domain-containing protein
MKRVRIGQSKIKGEGLFADEPIKKGELILRMSGRRVSEARLDALIARGKLRIDDPFEIAEGEYIMLDAIPLAINHSCAPNAGIRDKDNLYALRAIKAGEELSYDYSTMVGRSAPGERDWHMRCSCGAPACRKRIGNWLTLPPRRLSYYKKNNALPDLVLNQLLQPQAL